MGLDWVEPRTLEGAVSELGSEEALPIAGGMSVVLLMNTGLLEPERLVSLAEIDELHGVEVRGGVLEIGAMCTHHRLSSDPLLLEHVPELARMFGRIGNVRVRAWGTVGGSLAHADPAQDPAVLLGALGASVLARGPDGPREIPVSELSLGPFWTVLDPDELITTVRVPVPTRSERCSYLKFLPRTADDYAMVSVAARLAIGDDGEVSEAHLVLGSVGSTPIAAGEAAEALVGRQPLDPRGLDEMAAVVRESISPSSDARGSAEYRRDVAGVIAKRAIAACAST